MSYVPNVFNDAWNAGVSFRHQCQQPGVHTQNNQIIYEVAIFLLKDFKNRDEEEGISYYGYCLVKSLTCEATPLATQFFKRSYKISHNPGLQAFGCFA